MSDEKNELALRNASQLPAFIQQQENVVDYSRQEMNKVSRPPRIKIIQEMTGEPFKPPFINGDIIVTPQLIKIGSKEESFTFTPIYFFNTYICWNPIQMRNMLPAVREFSFNANSEVAKKASKFVQEACPENTQFPLKYSKILNFIAYLHDMPNVSVPVILHFSRGEYKFGEKFIGNLQARPKSPIYASRWRAGSETHKGPKGQWYGMRIELDPQPWVTNEEYNVFAKMQEEYHELHSSQTLEVDMADEDLEDSNTVNSGEY